MDWSPGQESALTRAAEWLAKPGDKPVFRLFGPAGTGKTSLAHCLAAQAGRVAYGAYTGKAALVMRRSGCQGATTIHGLIYVPKCKSGERLRQLEAELRAPDITDDDRAAIHLDIEEERRRMKQPAFSLNDRSPLKDCDLVIIDEVSMVGTRIANDLLSFGVPILALGDPAQLPPVRDGGFFTNAEPDALLTEIHRQAAGSPVIQLATTVRQGGKLELGEYGESRVLAKGSIEMADIADFDQVIVGKNDTRRRFNRRYRTEVLGRSTHLPERGDRLVCLRNNHDLGLLNGSLWSVRDAEVVDDDMMWLTVVDDDDANNDITCLVHRAVFEDRDIPFWSRLDAEEFDFGYAITCHKAQGSQFSSVLVVDEGHVFGRDANRWRYTGITRASERVTVVRA